MNVLLSYPRSGNHLVRFIIELLSGKKTNGCTNNLYDIPLCENKFSENIDFNIKTDEFIYFKFHIPPENQTVNNLILIVRSPYEALPRHGRRYELYFLNLKYFHDFKGNKLLLFYEDILTNKINFVNQLYNFLDEKEDTRYQYVINNLEKLFNLCAHGTNRNWGGYISKGQINFYVNKLSNHKKKLLTRYIMQHKSADYFTLISKKYFS